MTILRRFLDANKAACLRLNTVWGYPRRDFWRRYAEIVSDEVMRRPNQTVVDVGAGKVTPYAAGLEHQPGRRLIGVDVLEADMAENRALDERIGLDLMGSDWPFDSNVDVLTSRMVLEHLADTQLFADKVATALSPGGRTVHLFAGRYSLFAIANRLLPERVAQRVLFTLRPSSADCGGFKTYYDKTHPSAIQQVFEHSGLRTRDVLVSYEISQYFWFCFPLFMLVRIVETLITALDARVLASFVIVIADRSTVR